MGFESIPQRPPIPPKVEKKSEPVQVEVPQSERVEDVDKARAMAEAGNMQRSWAARDRKAANQEQNPNKKEWFESGARMQDEKAEYDEKMAAEGFKGGDK